MKVRIIKSFVCSKPVFRGIAGRVIELPPDVDWLQAGLVELMPGEKLPAVKKRKEEFVIDDEDDGDEDLKLSFKKVKTIEEATITPPEKAISRKKKK